MIKKLFLILGLVFILNGCAVTLDETLPSTDIVIRYGTPYYYDNTLTYYHYNGWYYYPYYRDKILYYHRYERPIPPRAGRPRVGPGHRHGPVPRPRYTPGRR